MAYQSLSTERRNSSASTNLVSDTPVPSENSKRNADIFAIVSAVIAVIITYNVLLDSKVSEIFNVSLGVVGTGAIGAFAYRAFKNEKAEDNKLLEEQWARAEEQFGL